MPFLENLLESELFGHVKGAFTGAIAHKKGLFETAEGGSLFLDEVGNTSLALQTKLLRALQERVYTPVGDTREHKADVRLIAATNRDLEAMVAQGTFRQELFYRLSIVPIALPRLCERDEDISTLAAHFLKKFAHDHGRPTPTLSPEAQQCLLRYPWPGNVRELENVMQRICVLCAASTITPAELPPEFLTAQSAPGTDVPRTGEELKECKRLAREKSIEEVERSFVLAALERTNWNISRAAQDVRMQRSNFQALMRRHGIVKPQ